MKPAIAIACLAVAAAVAACQAFAATSRPPPLDLRANMIEGINPAAIAIWDVGNAAQDDNGGLDPAQMDAAAWAKLQESAESLGTYAHRMAAAKVVRASGPDLVGGKLPEGVSSKEQIQAMIDANPAGFRASAVELERYADGIAKAAKAHDLKNAGELVFAFVDTCQACHERYWYRNP